MHTSVSGRLWYGGGRDLSVGNLAMCSWMCGGTSPVLPVLICGGGKGRLPSSGMQGQERA